jgi:hypothetical protein
LAQCLQCSFAPRFVPIGTGEKEETKEEDDLNA